MANQQIGKFTRSDMCRIFWIAPHQFDKIIKTAGDNLPKGENVLSSFKIYTDDTVEFIKTEYKLPVVVDPDRL